MASNLSILFRLIGSYLLIIIVVLLSGIYTIGNLSELNRIIRTVTTHDARMINLSEECQEVLYSSTAAEKKFFVSRDEGYRKQFKDLQGEFARRIDELASLADTEKKQNLLGTLRTLHTRYGELFDDMADRKGSHKAPGREIHRIQGGTGPDRFGGRTEPAGIHEGCLR